MRPTASAQRRRMFCYATWLPLAIVILFPATIYAWGDDSDLLCEARSLLDQANLAEEREARVLVEKALRILAEVQSPAPDVKALTRVCKTYLKVVDAFWQADRHKGSAEAERLLRDFRAENENPMYLQALLYQGRHHYWKVVEGNYPQGIEILNKMFEEIMRRNPQHRLARMYIGRPVEPLKADLERAPDGAPKWAVAGRDAM